jgi:hypothetical protein
MTRVCRDDLPDGVSEIFLQTGLDTNCPTGKSLEPILQNGLSPAKPIAYNKYLMDIASAFVH